MFNRSNVAIRVSKITHNQMEQEDHEVPLTVVSCEISPLTPELAGDLHDIVRGTLYTRTDAEVKALVGGVSFNLSIPPQAVAWRMAPDQGRGSFTLQEAKIDEVKASRAKKSQAWTLSFRLTCSPASDKQLAQIVERYLKTSYLTFEDAVPTLFDESPRASADDDIDDSQADGATAH